LFRGDAVFVFSDYFYGVKKNMKQAFFMGLLDFLFTVVLIVDIIFFMGRSRGLDTVMYGVIFAIIILYIAMKFYMYQLLVTFDLTNFKILKNSLIFTALGIKRNLMAFLGLIVLFALQIGLIFLALVYGLTVFIVLPFVYIFALIGFIATYAAYPIIDKYMIAPYANESIEAGDEESVIE
jgi:uncharacterized membrane protein YesL